MGKRKSNQSIALDSPYVEPLSCEIPSIEDEVPLIVSKEEKGVSNVYQTDIFLYCNEEFRKQRKNKKRRKYLKRKLEKEIDSDILAAEQAHVDTLVSNGWIGLIPCSFGSTKQKKNKKRKVESNGLDAATIDEDEEQQQQEEETLPEAILTVEHNSEKSNKELEESNKELKESNKELEESNKELEESNKELKELEESNKELKESKKELENHQPIPRTKGGKRQYAGASNPFPDVDDKYWYQRYRLFSKYDEGIMMDREGWFSVTPECIATHIAQRLQSDVIVDPFTGCGGNAIQFALQCKSVIAIDIDPFKIECARNNARLYGVEDRIEFIVGDAMILLPQIKADVVFLSPPWGGPEYTASKVFDLKKMIISSQDGVDLFQLARKCSKNVAYFLPRNVSIEQITNLAQGEPCEYEKNHINNRIKTITVYFGDLVHQNQNPHHP